MLELHNVEIPWGLRKSIKGHFETNTYPPVQLKNNFDGHLFRFLQVVLHCGHGKFFGVFACRLCKVLKWTCSNYVGTTVTVLSVIMEKLDLPNDFYCVKSSTHISFTFPFKTQVLDSNLWGGGVFLCFSKNDLNIFPIQNCYSRLMVDARRRTRFFTQLCLFTYTGILSTRCPMYYFLDNFSYQ